MRIMKLLLILLFAVSAFGQSIQDRVNKFEKPKTYSVEYDKFQKVTTVEVDRIYFQHPKGNGVWTNFETTAILNIWDDGTIDFGLYFNGPLFNNDTLRVLADGDVLEIEDDTIGYSTIVLIPLDKLEKIVNSKSVEMQIHGLEGKISDRDLARLKNLFSLTQKQETPH